MGTTNVSLRADRDYVKQLAIFAIENDITVGSLVRAALDKTLGRDLENASSFFAESFASKQNSVLKSNAEAQA
jgi:hypothetical protein